jgi:hypothetical protein
MRHSCGQLIARLRATIVKAEGHDSSDKGRRNG